MTMKSSDKLINKMKDQNIRPLPRWRFVMRENLVWSLLLLSVIFGSLAFSVILFSIQQIEFNLVTHITHSKFEFFMGLLPFLWIAFLLVFLVLGVIGMRNSKKGYKFSPLRITIINAAFSILLGTMLFIGGGAGWLEHVFAMEVTAYESVNEKKIKLWSMPEEGYLSGTIKKVDESSIRLIDFNDQTWDIDYGNAFIAPSVLMEARETIKITGEMTSDHTFRASEIRPWGQNRRGRKR